MRGTGAARHQQERGQREQEPPPDRAAVEADLRRVAAGSEAVRRRLGRHEQAIARELGRMRQVPADCPGAERLAVAADRLSAELAVTAVEVMADAAHCAELRAALESYAQTASFDEAMRQAAYKAGFEAGRLAGAAEEQARVSRAPRGRPARHRKHLKAVPVIAATGVAASLVTGTAVVATHDSAAVHPYAASRPVARMSEAPPDTAILVPQAGQSSSPRPSAAAASARPAPSVTPSAPVSSSPPPAPVPPPSLAPSAPAVPVLSVPRFLDLGDSTRGELPLTAGAQAVTWTATATDGITLSSYGGVVLAGQTVTLQVTDAPAGGGWVYISAGAQTFAVHVTSSLGPSA